MVEDREPNITTSDPPKVGDETAGTATLPLPSAKPVETGGPKGPEPTRYGDWERKGRCVDF